MNAATFEKLYGYSYRNRQNCHCSYTDCAQTSNHLISIQKNTCDFRGNNQLEASLLFGHKTASSCAANERYFLIYSHEVYVEVQLFKNQGSRIIIHRKMEMLCKCSILFSQLTKLILFGLIARTNLLISAKQPTLPQNLTYSYQLFSPEKLQLQLHAQILSSAKAE